MTDNNQTDKTTERWVVSPDHCKRMAKKYGWTLRRHETPESSPNDLLKTKCIFEGDAPLPKSYMETDDD